MQIRDYFLTKFLRYALGVWPDISRNTIKGGNGIKSGFFGNHFNIGSRLHQQMHGIFDAVFIEQLRQRFAKMRINNAGCLIFRDTKLPCQIAAAITGFVIDLFILQQPRNFIGQRLIACT